MKETDKYFALILWKAEYSKKSLIRTIEKMLSMISQFRVYFNRAQTKSDRGISYVDVFVQHSILIIYIKGDVE